MDNFNALSKSAILTKLALDGYFIDLLTLNSFIEKWQIEAIYENEFGVEFFDNNSYMTILNNLKEKYDETKKNLEENTNFEPSNIEDEQKDNEIELIEEEETSEITPPCSQVEEIQQENTTEEIEQNNYNSDEDIIEIPSDQDEESLDELAKHFEREAIAENAMQGQSFVEEHLQENIQFNDYSKEDDIEASIMPMAMRRLTPGPVAPHSSINVDYSYYSEEKLQPAKEDFEDEINNSDTEELLDNNFTQDEIEKADKLINEKYTDSDTEQEIVEEENKNSENQLDLMQLAQSFTENLTKPKEQTEPADLDKIFENSYTEPFENLKEYSDETDYEPVEPECIENFDNTPKNIIKSENSNLTAQDIREIIRDEISKQSLPVQQNSNIKEFVQEIVNQAAKTMPQNGFKFDISNQTLDMVAKAIAKKIAMQLNDYYKLNITKQNTKLELFREKTLELKEKNQSLTDENKKLKMLLLETNKNLNSYRPTLFGLYKFESRKKFKKK